MSSLQKTKQSIKDILIELAANTKIDPRNERLAINVLSRATPVRQNQRRIQVRLYSSPGMFPAKRTVTQTIEKQELAKALEEKIPVLAREHGGKLNAILRGSNAAFKQAKDRFLDQLEDHVRASMTKLYAPEQISRRNKEVECQLSQNMADPDRQKRLNGLMRFMASAVGTVTGVSSH